MPASKHQLAASAYHLKLSDSIARYLKSTRFSAEWIQNFLGHESYQTTMDMYGTISIDEMQEDAERLLN